MAEYRFLGNENVSGKTVLVRVDLNSNVEGSEVFESARIQRHSQTLKGLAEKGAKVVALAHQGRKGQDDCVSLKQHSEFVSEYTGKEVKLLPWDSDYVSEIKAMEPGQLILMENVRFHENEENSFSQEEASNIEWVQKISSCSDMFVQDALSVCHRAQPSVIGFSKLPSFAGPCLKSELDALKKLDESESPRVFVLGGAKVKDSVSLIKTLLSQGKADTFCVGGLLGELFLKASGKQLGAKDRFFEEKQLLEQHKEKIVLPVDVAIADLNDEREEISVDELPKDEPIYDIGMETVAEFKAQFKKAKAIVMNGPMGTFERMEFETGTKKVFSAVSKSRAFSLIGGGDTEAAMEQADFSEKDFSYVSLAGKALLKFLSKEELPGLKVLQK